MLIPLVLISVVAGCSASERSAEQEAVGSATVTRAPVTSTVVVAPELSAVAESVITEPTTPANAPSPATPSPATPSPATPSPATPSPATPSPATPSPATGSTTVDVSEPVRLRLAFSGDILVHSPLWRGAQRYAEAAGNSGYDFAPMLAALAPIHDQADLSVCHLETPIAPLGEELSTSPFYGVPAEVVDAIAAAGFDRCSTASNHTLDRGTAGIDRTVDELERVGIAQSGMARTPEEIEPNVFDVGGVAISHLSYTFSYNGLRPPVGEEWRSREIDLDRMLADASAARGIGAEVVIMSLHWGTETRSAVTDGQRRLAEALTASDDVDLIVGHHAHVLQPIEQINGIWVLFGLGNVLSNLPTSENFPTSSQDAAVATIDMAIIDGEITWQAPVILPTWVDKEEGWQVRDVRAELARDDISAGYRGRLERSLERSSAVVGDFIPPS